MINIWKDHKDKILNVLITSGIAIIGTMCVFAWNTYKTVEAFPALQDTVKTLQDTVAALDRSPLKIQRQIMDIKREQNNMNDDVEDINEDIDEIKDAQKQQVQTNIEILKLLVEIKNNGH